MPDPAIVGDPRRLARLLALAAARVGTLRDLGGKGSGNFGHKGRPGEVGGSSSGDGGLSELISHSGVGSDYVHLLYDDDAASEIAEAFDLNTVKLSEIEVARRKIAERSQMDLRRLFGNSVVAYRGVKGTEDKGNTVSLTLSKFTAQFHAKGGEVLKLTVPVDRVYSYSNSIGYGTFDEQEIIVPKDVLSGLKTLGGPGSGNFGHAGRPGQVGGSSDGVGLPLEQAAFVQKFDMQAIPPGAMHRIMINPRTGMMILSKMHSDPGSNDAMDETHSGVYSDALGGDSEGFRQTGFDDYYRGFITGPEPGFPKGRLELMNPANYEVDPEDITEDDIAQESDAVASIVSQLVKNGGLKRETLIEGLHPVVQESLPFMFPSARKRALGGPGSGNFGHAGRPGQVGGSSPGDVDITFISSMTTPIERTLDRLDMSEANVRSAIASMTRDLPGKWLIEVTPHGPNELSIDGTGIFPEDESGPSGSFSRVFAIDKETGEHFVVHSSFILPESLQNQGHAKLMMRNALETYERMGVSSIDTQAVDVGAYAWARAGFLPTRPQAVERTIKARLTSFEEKGLITSDDYRRLWEASTGSRGLWRVADDPKGKLVLRGMSYDAKLRFKDAAAMRRARHYAGLES